MQTQQQVVGHLSSHRGGRLRRDGDQVKSQRMQSGIVVGDQWWHEKTMKKGSLGSISGRLQRGPLQDVGAGAAAGGCVVGVDAEPSLHHQGAVWRAVLALVI